jgi:hypothetical protein
MKPRHAAPAATLTRRLLTAAGVILALAAGILTVPAVALLAVHPHR